MPSTVTAFKSFDKSAEFPRYTGVSLLVDSEGEVFAGTDKMVFTTDLPTATPQIAALLLAKIQDKTYQPMRFDRGHIDPAVELGDEITANGLTTRMYKQDLTYGKHITSKVETPWEEEVDHEFPYKGSTERLVRQQVMNLETELRIQSGMIEARVTSDQFKSELKVRDDIISAKVSKTGGNRSFAWELVDDSWTVKANNSEVFKITASGAYVKGEIQALSGHIGGFDIMDTYLSVNGLNYGDTEGSGAYFGTQGIQLGANFKVDASGNLSASSGTFSGNVYAGSIQAGGDFGTFGGGGITFGTIDTSQLSTGINTNLGYASDAGAFFNGGYKPAYAVAGTVRGDTVQVDDTMYIRVNGTSKAVSAKSITVKDGNGANVTLNYWGYD